MKKVLLTISLLLSGAAAYGITHVIANAVCDPVSVQFDIRMAPDE